MGLDQYAYIVSKPDDSIKNFMKNRLSYCLPNDIHSFDLNNVSPEELRLVEALIPYGIKLTLWHTAYDYELIRRDHDIPPEATLTGIGCRPDAETYTYSLKTDKETKQYTVIVSEYDLNHRYEIIEQSEVLLVRMTELHYWRKATDVQDLMYDNLPVENCGYYLMNYDIMEQLHELDPEFEIPELNDSEAVVYHEWY